MKHHDHTKPEATGEVAEVKGPSFGGHGMLVVGEDIVYLSHLPMFMLPHNFQAILEVAFVGEGDPNRHYLSFLNHGRVHSGATLFTLSPTEKFNLTDLVDPAETDLAIDPADRKPPQPRRLSFNADIFEGHFEKGGEGITHAVVDVTNVVIFRQLDTYGQGPPPLPRLAYFLFGNAQELFLAHVITQPPDFDQVLSVKVDGHGFTDEDLRHGVLLTVPERANSMSERLREGERMVAEAQLVGDAPTTVEIQVEAGPELYFEEGELRVLDTFDQTEEERSAGFR